MFVFRYAQTINSSYLDVLSNFWLYFLGYFVYSLIILFFFVLPFDVQTMFTQETKLSFKGVDEKISKLIENEPLVFSINVSLEFGIRLKFNTA